MSVNVEDITENSKYLVFSPVLLLNLNEAYNEKDMIFNYLIYIAKLNLTPKKDGVLVEESKDHFSAVSLVGGEDNKSSKAVKVIQSIPYALTKVKIFHADCGKEFDNQLIDDMLEVFGITCSLSQAGCPYDNAVAESTYRSFKLEFIRQETFQSLEELALKTKDYVHWWKYRRIHGGLNYQTPLTKRLTV